MVMGCTIGADGLPLAPFLSPLAQMVPLASVPNPFDPFTLDSNSILFRKFGFWSSAYFNYWKTFDKHGNENYKDTIKQLLTQNR